MKKFLKNLFSKDNDVIEENDDVLSNPVDTDNKNYLNKNGSINWRDNPELRQGIYKSLKRRTGKFKCGVTTGDGKTPEMTGKDLEKILREIALEIGLPEDKWYTISQQVSWACTSQKYCNLKSSLRSSYAHNKSAAILAGYMSFEDVLLLNK